MTTDTDSMPIKKKTPTKLIIGIFVGAFLLMWLCIGGVAFLGRDLPKDPVIPAFDSAPTPGSGKAGTPPNTPAAPPAAITVKGKNNAVVPAGATLNGAFTVEYAFGSWCGIVHFLKADGSDGAQFFEMINECAGDLNDKATGSTLVHLTNVTMLKVENTSGNWSLKFTPVA